MAEFTVQFPFEIAQRIELRGTQSYTWFVVTFAASEPAAPENFSLEIAAVLSLPFRVVGVQGLSFEDLQAVLRQSATDGIVLTGFQGFDPVTWGAWDINRSIFQRPGPIALWLSSAELAQFCNLAPNLRSFGGGSIFGLSSSGGQLTEGERSQRIQELERHYNVSSPDIIERAQAGRLPPEPHFVEWLVLLGRGDLV
jgi:hypothetical protein